MVADHLAIFGDYSYDVMQGSILIPPSMQNDQEFLRLLNRYRTICYYSKPGAEVRQIVSLNAANMALRKELLEVVGLFDERIGPGASGTSMDVDSGKGFCGPGDASVTSRARWFITTSTGAGLPKLILNDVTSYRAGAARFTKPPACPRVLGTSFGQRSGSACTPRSAMKDRSIAQRDDFIIIAPC